MFDRNVLDSITVITHSAVRIGGDKVIYIDPIGIEGEPHDADLILITHPHADHFSPGNIRKVLKDSTVVACPESMAGKLGRASGREPVSLTAGMSTSLAGVPVEAVAAYNKKKIYHPKKKGWLGYVLTVGETRVYIAGDTESNPENKAVTCDIALLPVDTSRTMTPDQAAELAKLISAQAVIPIHYGALLGGKKAPVKFKQALDPSIECDIRDTVYSSILVKMMVLPSVLGFIVGFTLMMLVL